MHWKREEVWSEWKKNWNKYMIRDMLRKKKITVEFDEENEGFFILTIVLSLSLFIAQSVELRESTNIRKDLRREERENEGKETVSWIMRNESMQTREREEEEEEKTRERKIFTSWISRERGRNSDGMKGTTGVPICLKGKRREREKKILLLSQ